MSLHNKSGSAELRVINAMKGAERDKILLLYRQVSNRTVMIPGMSACWLPGPADGRFTLSRIKICWYYHVAAYLEFGEDTLTAVTTTKSELGARTISHLCGSINSRCCNPKHIVVESKAINEERRHCHFFLLKPGLTAEQAEWFVEVLCPHNPKCGRARAVTSAEALIVV